MDTGPVCPGRRQGAALPLTLTEAIVCVKVEGAVLPFALLDIPVHHRPSRQFDSWLTLLPGPRQAMARLRPMAPRGNPWSPCDLSMAPPATNQWSRCGQRLQVFLASPA